MLATVSNRELFVSDGDRQRKRSVKLANALAIELMHYGIVIDREIVDRISRHRFDDASQLCGRILKMYTIGNLNPPLFRDWEDRTEFTFEEFVVQIFGYAFQISGNDLADPRFLDGLLSRVEFKKANWLKFAGDDSALARFNELVRSRVALNRATQQDLVALAQRFYLYAPRDILSAEARIAVLVGIVESGVSLEIALERLNCQPVDILRFAAAKFDFDGVKLPADVIYGPLVWRERIQILRFLSRSSFDDLCETMGINRQAWIRFFNHIHIFRQKDFRNRFAKIVSAALLSVGARYTRVPQGRVSCYLAKQSEFYDVTEGGNLAYRTFASRIQRTVEEQDFDTFEKDIAVRPNYLFRNIGALSHVCTKKTEKKFVNLFRQIVDNANASVLLSIVQIDVDAKFRIIDSKGNTTVKPADYNPVIRQVQAVALSEIKRRYGFEGQVKVAPKLKKKMVPFLSTNSELDRGSRVPFEKVQYLYFLLHWVQRANRRTDLDHSYVCVDKNWNTETIYFGNQANAFIKQSGDITNAPAPNGGTEYGRIDLKVIPKNVRFIVPIINVFSGDVFSENEMAYAGFMFSDENRFSIKRKHTRYDLSQPAKSNIPFVIDVRNRELVIVDFNNRRKEGLTAHSSIGEIRKLISVLETKQFMTMSRFAKILSGNDEKTSLTIKANSKNDREIEPADLQRLVSKNGAVTAHQAG